MKQLKHVIDEGFKVQDNIVYFDESSGDIMNTKLGKTLSGKPREGTLPNTRVKYYMPYQVVVPKREWVPIGEALKGASTTYKVDKASYDAFVARTAKYLSSVMPVNVDTVLQMYTSSTKLLPDVLDAMHDSRIVKNAIKKSVETLRMSYAIYAKPNVDDKTITAIQQSIEKAKDRGEFKIHKDSIGPQFRKFYVDWLKLDISDASSIVDKNICVIDDFVSSGQTLDIVSELLLKAGAKSVVALAIAKTK